MTVIVYTAPSCMACKMTERHLQKRNVTFVKLPMDDHALEVARIAGITAAPLVQVDNGGGNSTYWGGYRPDRIDALIA
jgi:glutaredoxin